MSADSPYLSYQQGLYPGFHAAFSLRAFQERFKTLSKDGLPKQFLSLLSIRNGLIAQAEQVHGADVAVVTEAGVAERVDGLATCSKDLFLAIYVADCLPIYLWSNQPECIAILHAGWRGTVAGIAQHGVQAMKDCFGVKPGNLRALLGPCICAACYEVGPEVAQYFHDSEIESVGGNRFRLNLRRANARQLAEAGLSEAAILSDDQCTGCRLDLFFSYRAEKDQTGRMIAIIGMKS
ncbi:MAG: peptidoglycan editing factor PgeF [bacterium]